MALDLGVKFNQNPDEKAKVSANDRATGYLEDKFTSSDSSVTISVQDEGQQEKIDLTVSGGGGGGENLAATLVLGKATGGNDITLTTTDKITCSSNSAEFQLHDGGFQSTWGYNGLTPTNNSTISVGDLLGTKFITAAVLDGGGAGGALDLQVGYGQVGHTNSNFRGSSTGNATISGTGLGFYGSAAVAQAANPGVAAGADAVVINNIVTALQNLGLTA